MAGAVTTTRRKTAKPEPEQPPEQLVIVLPPDYFANGWGCLRAITKLSKTKAWWLEHHDGAGCWLVAAGGEVVAAAWIPEEPGLAERLPDLKRAPDDIICFLDPDNRLDNLCARLCKRYNAADALAPGLDEFLQVRPGSRVDGSQLTLSGMAAPIASVWLADERHDIEAMEIPPVQWRSMLRTFEQASRDNVTLAPETMKVIMAMRGMRAPVFEFGTGTRARLRLVPDAGGYPYVLAVAGIGGAKDMPTDEDTMPVLPIGPEPDDEVGTLPALVPQTYDVEGGQWGEAEPFNPDEPWDD